MILPPEYNWLESYLNNDMLWLEESLNWDESFDLILSDFIFISTFPILNIFLCKSEKKCRLLVGSIAPTVECRISSPPTRLNYHSNSMA